MLNMASLIYESCDDSIGTIGTIGTIGSVMGQALDDIGTVASQTGHDADRLADRVYDGVRSKDYG